MSEIDTAGVVIVGFPILLFFLAIWWIWGEEKRRERIRAERREEWNQELRAFREGAREISSFGSRKIMLIDLGGKTPEEQEAFIEHVRKELEG